MVLAIVIALAIVCGIAILVGLCCAKVADKPAPSPDEKMRLPNGWEQYFAKLEEEMKEIKL